MQRQPPPGFHARLLPHGLVQHRVDLGVRGHRFGGMRFARCPQGARCECPFCLYAIGKAGGRIDVNILERQDFLLLFESVCGTVLMVIFLCPARCSKHPPGFSSPGRQAN